MNNSTHHPQLRRTAFTLIELLVVIAVIGVLAALIFPITGVLKKKRMIAVAQAELAQVETAIDAYKSKYGTYPPDNPNSSVINQIFFELKGTIRSSSGNYTNLDGSGEILSGEFATAFLNAPNPPLTGFVNTSASTKGDDDKGVAVNFLKDLKPSQSGTLPGFPKIKLLTCSVSWDRTPSLVPSDTTGMNPWQYNSSHPVNNPNSYDLWVDLLINGKTNRVSNWSKKPQVL